MLLTAARLVLVDPGSVGVLLQCAQLERTKLFLSLALGFKVLLVVLLGHSLGIGGQACHRHSDSQCLLRFVKLGVALARVDLVFEVEVKVVEPFDTEDEGGFVEV